MPITDELAEKILTRRAFQYDDISLSDMCDISSARYLYITRVVVHEDYRRHGIATEFIRDVIRCANKSRSVKSILFSAVSDEGEELARDCNFSTAFSTSYFTVKEYRI